MTALHRRVIVTGSRALKDHRPVRAELDAVAAELQPEDHLMVVHGGCATGADRAASDWYRAVCEAPSNMRAHERAERTGAQFSNDPVRWRGNGAKVGLEVWPADWENCSPACIHAPRRHRDGRPYCPQAGPRRNADMIAAGADLVLAFPLSSRRADSPGTWHCIGLAAQARIPFRRIYPRR